MAKKIIPFLILALILLVGCISRTPENYNTPKVQDSNLLLYTPWPKEANENQIKFIAEHYAVTQPHRFDIDANEIKKYNPNIVVTNYKNLIGIWPSGKEWEVANQHEDWFIHSSSTISEYNRIKLTNFGFWVMDITNPEYIDFWINSLKEDLNQNNYDGVFCDNANQIIPNGRTTAVPYGYSDELWSESVYNMLDRIKKELGDKLVVFNGLYKIQHQKELRGQYTGTRNLEVTDGGAREGFVVQTSKGTLLSEEDWKFLMNMILTNPLQDKYEIFHVSSAAEKSFSTEERLFAFASFLLIKGDTSVYGFMDPTLFSTDYDPGRIQYYPEYTVNLGIPLETKTSLDDYFKNGVYQRNFENGKVLVNPSDKKKTVTFNQTYQLVIPVGGGAISDQGTTDGKLEYETVNQITINSQTGIILLK